MANDDVDAAFASVTVDADGNVTATDNYLYKPGRPTGQLANGGSAVSTTLTLQSNPINPNDRAIVLNSPLLIQLPAKTTGTIGLDLDYRSTTAVTNPIFTRIRMPQQQAGQFQAQAIIGTVLKTGGGVPFQMFAVTCGFQLQAVNSSGQVFFFAPSFGDDGQIRTVGANSRIIIAQPNYSALTAGSTGNPSTLTIADMAPVVDASWNAMSLARFLAFVNPSGSHAVGVTDYVGMDVPDTITKPTNVFTIRNLEDRAKMVHRGAAVFGDLGITVPAAGIELEVRSTIGVFVAPRMTNAQIAALPAVPDGSQVYCTDVGALVIGMHQMLGGAWVAM